MASLENEHACFEPDHFDILNSSNKAIILHELSSIPATGQKILFCVPPRNQNFLENILRATFLKTSFKNNSKDPEGLNPSAAETYRRITTNPINVVLAV